MKPCHEIYQHNFRQREPLPHRVKHTNITAQNLLNEEKIPQQIQIRMDKLKEDWNRLQLRFLKTCKPNRYSKFIFVWNVWNHAKETVHTVSDKKLWFCPSPVISQGPLRISTRSWYYQEIELYSRATVLLKPHQWKQISVFSNSISPRVYVDIGGGGTPGNSWWGCTARFSKSRPYFWPKNVIFHIRFQTWPKIHTHFQTRLL